MRVLSLTIVLAIASLPASSQLRVVDPYNPVIAGKSVSCVAAGGQAVAFVVNPGLNDVGRAIRGNPLIGIPPKIEMNPQLLSRYPATLQLFWYGHECAHHALGHTVFFTPANEAAADCWSIRTIKQEGLVTKDDVAGFVPYFANNPGSPWGHLPGPARTAHFMECYGRGTRATFNDAPPAREDDYDSCVAKIRSVNQCLQEDYPERCINTCMRRFGFSYPECSTRRCLATPENVQGWRESCSMRIRDERDECGSKYKK